jgi:outer membrane protein
VEFSIQASPRFDGFDESDSDIFEGMDERKFSMDLGFGIEYARDDWKFELSSLHDVLGRSNGTELSTGLSKVFRSGSLFIEPGIGFSYLDSRHVDYYYGVSTNEVASFRPRFEGDDAVNTNLGITVTTPALFNGLTRFGFEHTWYDPDISDSPLTDEDTSLSFFFAYSRFF